MRVRYGLIFTAVCAFVFTLAVTWSQNRRASDIERGRYLVERVAMCVDCHSPRNERGEFIQERWLGGSKLDFSPLHPMPWAENAPPLAGLPGWEDAEAVKLLETGLTPNGERLRPPMPPYQMHAADAKAVVAYLRSLPPVAQ